MLSQPLLVFSNLLRVGNIRSFSDKTTPLRKSKHFHNNSCDTLFIYFVILLLNDVCYVQCNRGTTRERGGGVKIGGYNSSRNATLGGGVGLSGTNHQSGGRGSGLKIGSPGYTNNRIYTTSTTYLPHPVTPVDYPSPSIDNDRYPTGGIDISSGRDSGGYGGGNRASVPRAGSSGLTDLNIGLVVPYKSFGTREYTKAVMSAISGLQRKLSLFRNYDLKGHLVMKEMTPSPTGKS